MSFLNATYPCESRPLLEAKEAEIAKLEQLQKTRRKVTLCVGCCCCIPCLPITCLRCCCPCILDPWDGPAEMRIKRCWEIGMVGDHKPENRCDLCCQAIGTYGWIDLLDILSCKEGFRKTEYLLPPERQRMKELTQPPSPKTTPEDDRL